jgi:Dolichyl-phosphate-mannose-protein mannosyltransferase
MIADGARSTDVLPRVKTRAWLVAAVCVVVLATALRVHDITKWSLNNDEVAEVRWSSRSMSRMMGAVRADAVHPPLDYFVQFAISHSRGPEWLHRVPPALFGIATIALVIALGTLWFGPPAGVVAGFLMAIAPMHVRFSQEVRPYSMALFFVCASLTALELYARSRRRRWAVTWFAMVFLAGATLYFAGMIAGATSLFRIVIARRGALADLWRRLPLIIAGWTVLYSPWLPVVIRLGQRPPPQPPDTLDWLWWNMRIQTFATGDWLFEPVSFGSWAFWVAVAIGLALTVRYRLLATAAFWFLGGTALEIVVLHLHPHFSTPRYLMPSWPAAFLLAGAAIAALSSTWPGRAIGAVVLLLFAGHAALTLDAYYRGQRSDWRGIAEYVHERAKNGETVILTNFWVERNFGFYWRSLPPRPEVNVVTFVTSPDPWKGPVWVVTGQCEPRAALQPRNLMSDWAITDAAQVFYVRPGEDLPMDRELCPE